MTDDVLKRRRPIRSQINTHEDDAVKYWTKHLNISREELQQLVDKVGNSASAVRKQLGLTDESGPGTRSKGDEDGIA